MPGQSPTTGWGEGEVNFTMPTTRALGICAVLVLLFATFGQGASTAHQPPTCNGKAATIVAAENQSTIQGTSGDDVIVASDKDVIEDI